MDTIRFALVQMNPTVGAFESNIDTILRFYGEAIDSGAQFVVSPELALSGYPPEDLVLKPAFLDRSMDSISKLAQSVHEVPLAVGFVEKDEEYIFDSAAVIQDGSVKTVYRKMVLPNYGVFDEKRYFESGSRSIVLDTGMARIAVTICEDIWNDEGPWLAAAQTGGARILINLSASPYHLGKWRERQSLLRERALQCKISIVYANMVGGQDDLVFDGHSLVVSHDGCVISQCPGFLERCLTVDVPYLPPVNEVGSDGNVSLVGLKLPDTGVINTADHTNAVVPSGFEKEVYEALILGTRDYVRKNGFSDVTIGLSGGIDSALVSSIAVDALGKEHVHVLFMPSRYTSTESTEDARQTADNLGIDLLELPIDGIFQTYRDLLDPVFEGYPEDKTEENLQARIRGNILMALSNKFGYLVLATGNKSEMACGYATLYGDMAGGFAVIKDVPKTMVFNLVRYRNAITDSSWLPVRLLTKAPSAELKADQKDSDSLPPYDLLDPILQRYVEEDRGLEDLIREGFERSLVLRIISLVDGSEYKRRQAPPGIKITPKAFGKDRRLPVTNQFRYPEA